MQSVQSGISRIAASMARASSANGTGNPNKTRSQSEARRRSAQKAWRVAGNEKR